MAQKWIWAFPDTLSDPDEEKGAKQWKQDYQPNTNKRNSHGLRLP
jgi:hypothetical protein